MTRFFKIIVTVSACLLSFLGKAQVQPDFSAAVPSTCAPVLVQFADSSKGSPAKWFWDFGNGDTSSLQNPKEVYTAAGNYIVKLTAGNGNSSSSVTKTITITGSIKAGFTYQYNNVCAAPSSFTFTATNYQDTINYLWNFGNGKTTTGSPASTVFTANGSDIVQLITSTPQGCKDTATQLFAIGSATVSFSSFSVVCKNAPVTFTNTSNPTPLSIIWYINGVNAGSGNTLTHTFTAAGSDDIKMVASFGSCNQTAQKTITVKDKPVAGFSESGSLQSCTLPAAITFTNSSTNANTYEWIFGDGNTSTQSDINYTYNKAGTFSPSLVAFNGDGCSDTLTKNALVRLGPPVISSFTALPKSGCVPEDITSGPNITSPDPVASYDWNSGDNNLHFSGNTFSHTYNNEGYYNVSLTVMTQSGCSGSYTLKQAVAAGTKPIADFAVNSPTVCASVPVQFIDKSIGTVTSWNYNFGDGLSTSGTGNPVHVFTKIGSNDVTLYESNKGCSADPKTIKNIVTVLPPIAGFSFAYNCANPLQVQFTDKSQQPDSWQWDFDDGQISASQNPLYTYAKGGTYSVKLKAGNANGCTSSDTAIIIVSDEKPTLQMLPSNPFICRNDSIRLSASSTSGSIAAYTWNLGDGSPLVKDSTVSHIYTKSNDYKPFVTVQYANKCSQDFYFPSLLHVYGPTASFTVSQGSTCIPVNVLFTNSSTTDNIHPVISQIWDYGNGESDGVSGYAHSHTYYQTGGSFIPKLTVTDAAGCVDSSTGIQPVIAKGATAGFTYTINQSCDSAQVNFTNTSVPYYDEIISYNWDFGDGKTLVSSYANLVYTYHTSGMYKITLTITTKGGCIIFNTDVISITISSKPNITIAAPDAACVSSGIALSASVPNNSLVSQWTWNLDNGTQQTGQSINVNYTQPAAYNFLVVATLAGNCLDSAYQKITINDLPKTNAGADGFVCAGNTINLQASGTDSYQWQQVNNELSCTNCAAPIAQPAYSESYVVTGTSVAGCSSNDTVFVDVQQKQILTLATDKTSVCLGSSIQLQASGTDEYQWQPPDGLSNPSIANPVASPVISMVYSVTGWDSRHCFTDTKTTAVSIEAPPQFNIVDSVVTIARGRQEVIQTTGSADIVRWLWKPAPGLSCSDCAQPELTATINGTYSATAYTANGCSDSDEIKVILLCDASGIFIPAAFTPNGDGKNDFFYPLSFANSQIISFTVFGRSGQVIFHNQNTSTGAIKDGWNGMYGSLPMPSDTYIYRMEIKCEDKVIPFSGTVILIR